MIGSSVGVQVVLQQNLSRYGIADSARRKGVVLTTTVAKDVPPRVVIDGRHVRQILLNLLALTRWEKAEPPRPKQPPVPELAANGCTVRSSRAPGGGSRMR